MSFHLFRPGGSPTDRANITAHQRVRSISNGMATLRWFSESTNKARCSRQRTTTKQVRQPQRVTSTTATRRRNVSDNKPPTRVCLVDGVKKICHDYDRRRGSSTDVAREESPNHVNRPPKKCAAAAAGTNVAVSVTEVVRTTFRSSHEPGYADVEDSVYGITVMVYQECNGTMFVSKPVEHRPTPRASCYRSVNGAPRQAPMSERTNMVW